MSEIDQLLFRLDVLEQRVREVAARHSPSFVHLDQSMRSIHSEIRDIELRLSNLGVRF